MPTQAGSSHEVVWGPDPQRKKVQENEKKFLTNRSIGAIIKIQRTEQQRR
jgi:hypothetical protein